MRVYLIELALIFNRRFYMFSVVQVLIGIYSGSYTHTGLDDVRPKSIWSLGLTIQHEVGASCVSC